MGRSSELSSTLKCSNYLFLILSFLGGTALLGLSLWTAITVGSFSAIITDDAPGLFPSVYLMMAAGAVLIFNAAVGIFGILLGSRNILIGACFFMVIIFIAQTIGGVLMFVYYPIARNAAQESIALYDVPGNEDIRDGWDTIQGVLECCGMISVQDWSRRVGPPNFPQVPDNCCADKFTCTSTGDQLFLTPCDVKLHLFFQLVGGFGLGILFFELVAITVMGLALRQF